MSTLFSPTLSILVMFRAVLHNKIGNVLALLAQEVPTLASTKALKLLYLIDERSVRETGTPITHLEYEVWKLGPVAREIHRELRYDEKVTKGEKIFSLKDFVSWYLKENDQYGQNGKPQIDVYITPKPGVKPDLSELSEYEEELVREIAQRYKFTPARDLVKLLHEKDTLWSRKVNEMDLHFASQATSNVPINFKELIQDDPLKLMALQAASESLEFEEAFTQ